MGRPIKFRAWDGEKMLYSERGDFYLMPNGEIDIPSSTGHEFTRHTYPIMQFTGLKDKNGVEIYDGDIVQFYKGYVDDTWTDSEQGRPFVIVWDEKELCYRARRKNMLLVPGCGQQGTHKWQWEILGNVHSNPELPKKMI